MDLTCEEMSMLNERKDVLKAEHEQYVNGHPELKSLLSAFMSAVLMEKPANVLTFAHDHFAALVPTNTPMVRALQKNLIP